jgi:hypothetical protein
LACLTRTVEVFDHVFVGFVLSVDSGFCSFDGEAEGVCDDKGLMEDVADHEAHDFNAATGAGVHDHLGEGDRRDLDVLEVVGVGAPWLLVVDVFLLFDRVGVRLIARGVCEVDGIVQLCMRLSVIVLDRETYVCPHPTSSLRLPFWRV